MHLLECSENGALQLQLMSGPSYAERFVKLALGENYQAPMLKGTHAIYQGQPVLCGADMSLKSIDRLCEQRRHLGFDKLILIALPFQLEALHSRYAGHPFVELYDVPLESVTQEFSIELYTPAKSPFVNDTGGYIYDTDIPIRRKAGRPSTKKKEQTKTSDKG